MSVFDTLVGQQHMIVKLQGAVLSAKNNEETQEMTHAWVFTGPPGSGRSSAAVAFAQALVCPNLGCGTCNACLSAANGGHPDVEIIRTEGLSIKIDEVRELLARVAWAPSMGGWRVVVMEDADRLTESAANALLKAIEEPGNRTVWLLCAPTLHDVLPTIRSRCRHMQLVTPSTKDVAAVLQSRDGISPQMADFAARVSQGHIGRAKYIATSEHVRSNRKEILKSVTQLNNVADAFKAAQRLVDIATDDAKAAAEIRDEKEQDELAQAYGKGATGRGMATGGSKALKELEKEQKTRTTRMVRDSLDAALLDIATLYRDIMMVQSGHIDALINLEMAQEINAIASVVPTHKTIQRLDAVMKARKALGFNAAPLLTIEALMCALV